MFRYSSYSDSEQNGSASNCRQTHRQISVTLIEGRIVTHYGFPLSPHEEFSHIELWKFVLYAGDLRPRYVGLSSGAAHFKIPEALDPEVWHFLVNWEWEQ